MSEKRLVLQPKTAIKVVDRITSYDIAAGDAIAALKTQIEKYRIMAASAIFTAEEAQTLKVLVQTLNALSAEDRARQKDAALADVLANLSEDELRALEARTEPSAKK